MPLLSVLTPPRSSARTRASKAVPAKGFGRNSQPAFACETKNAPSGLPSKVGSLVQAEVRAVGAPHASWEKPVRVTFRRLERGWKLVGLERMADEPNHLPGRPEAQKVAAR